MPRLSLAALGLLLAVSPACACGGQSVYLDSAFRTGPTGWGDADAQFQVAGSEATIASPAGMQSARWDAGLFVGDADACVTLTMPASAGNGKQVARFNGDPPRGPSYVGVLAASSPGKTGDTWSITDFKVTAPQAASDDGDGAPSSRSRRKR